MLSKVLEEIVEVCGYAATLELCRAYGGRTVNVPNPIPETHPLALTMGHKPSLALAQRFGGIALAVPAERTMLLGQRNLLIAQDYTDDLATVSALSVKYGLTRKRITEVLDEQGIRRRSLDA